MGSGHFEAYGRYDRWDREALILAFIIDAVGGRRSLPIRP